MEHTKANVRDGRVFFTHLKDAVELPDLTTVQIASYQWFLEEGLKELLDEVSPISDYSGTDLDLILHEPYLDEPKTDMQTAKERNTTFEAPLRVKARLVNKKTGEIKEQEIYMGDFPIMTPRGTFIFNGVERVVVSQLMRSPGVFFTKDITKEKEVYGAKIIPNRGAWLEIETNHQGVMYIKIDRKRKVAVTSLLRAFGFGSNEEIKALFSDTDTGDVKYIDMTLAKDSAKNHEEGLKEVYKRIRPGDLATADNAKQLIEAMFFNFDRYDFSKVGRYKLNQKLGHNLPINKENRVLRREDLVDIIKKIIRLNNGEGREDDIDHLGNRRVRAVGELIQGKFRIGLARMERNIKDRMSTMDLTQVTPSQLINPRPITAVIREFFASSQLSQFMDQNNPLSEMAHKRRLSAMGPGGLSRERAGFEVRDVHRSHYGRICPIETSEGPNIGLIGHLASYARINEYGFIETPYRKVLREVDHKDEKALIGKTTFKPVTDASGKEVIAPDTTIDEALAKQVGNMDITSPIKIKSIVTDEIIYLDAFEEEQAIIAPATSKIDEQGRFEKDKEEIRVKGEPLFEKMGRVQYVDVSPKQFISITTSLIPFLEHDDANRALMGSNMQRQAVPVLKPQAPVVGTGIERRIAVDSGHVLVALKSGKVIEVDGRHVTVLEEDGHKRFYELRNFDRSNSGNSITQRPIVEKGQKVKKGDALCDSSSTEGGELAIGQNMIVAFMSWEGGNFEDAILISDRVVREDRLSSIHIEDHMVEVRDTKLGPEVITRDIPNVGEEKLANLDEEGIIRIGAEVSSGDILVGKISPKGETDLTAEERLLRAIFGEKARDVKDSSLTMSHGTRGKVIDIKIFSRENGDKLSTGVIKAVQVSIATLRKIQVGDKMAGRHGNKGVISRIVPEADMPFMQDGRPVDIILSPLGVTSRMNIGQIFETHMGWAAYNLGYKVATPPMNGITEETIQQELVKAGFEKDGKVQLLDGRTGQAFDQRTTVGVMYMLKLHHLVEEKIHMRSIGPYSLVTQQPLGGKAQFGGQRFGEMEVWALEAYGAAYTLQEMLTIKSDDVMGRSKAYESIIKKEPIREPNVPASFEVLVNELKGLGLDVELVKSDLAEQNERLEEGISKGDDEAEAKVVSDVKEKKAALVVKKDSTKNS